MANPAYGGAANATGTNVVREQFTDSTLSTVDAIGPLTNILTALQLWSTVKGSRQLSLAITNLEQAIMWLEKV